MNIGGGCHCLKRVLTTIRSSSSGRARAGAYSALVRTSNRVHASTLSRARKPPQPSLDDCDSQRDVLGKMASYPSRIRALISHDDYMPHQLLEATRQPLTGNDRPRSKAARLVCSAHSPTHSIRFCAEEEGSQASNQVDALRRSINVAAFRCTRLRLLGRQSSPPSESYGELWTHQNFHLPSHTSHLA